METISKPDTPALKYAKLDMFQQAKFVQSASYMLLSGVCMKEIHRFKMDFTLKFIQNKRKKTLKKEKKIVFCIKKKRKNGFKLNSQDLEEMSSSDQPIEGLWLFLDGFIYFLL